VARWAFGTWRARVGGGAAARFGGTDLYVTLAEKAAALGYSLILNHPFVDGNKRIGHAAMLQTHLVSTTRPDA
jgi:hypothetical protein